MNETRLRELLREAPVPDVAGAERRGLAVAVAAFREHEAAAPARRRRTSPRRLALATIVAALACGLLLSLASASVRHWVGDVFSREVPKARPGLAATPGGGRLLVSSQAGPWVVGPDGSRRLLGDYREASWSPRGLYVATASGRTLSAVEPDGTPHWSLGADAPVTDPRWSPAAYPYRIAYRSGQQLRVAFADGKQNWAVAADTAPVAPTWMPRGLPELAYVDGAGRLRIVESENGRALGSARALPGVAKIEWGEEGESLLEASPAAVRVQALRISKLDEGIGIEQAWRLPLPAGATVRDAAFAPRGSAVAVLLERGRGAVVRSSVLVYRPGKPARSLFAVSGSLSQIAFSPNGKHLLVTWPAADEWLFLPLGRGLPRAVGNVSAAFAPGALDAAFPGVEGWCCSANR